MTEFFNTPHLGYYFHYIVFFLNLTAILQCAKGIIYDNRIVATNQLLGMFAAVIFIILMGMRPHTAAYGDTINYTHQFKLFVSTAPSQHWVWQREWLFDNLMRLFAKYSNLYAFFTLCAAIYVGTLWVALRRIFGEYNFVPFLIVISMFTFWTYGVNGVRNGMGASLFILAISYADNIPAMLTIAFIAIGFHNSVLLMIGAALLAWVMNDSRIYLGIWVLCVVISFLFGTTIQEWIAGYANELSGENKLTNYLVMTEREMKSEGLIVSTTFRWDFIAYSAMAVALGLYFTVRRNFQDEYYRWILNTYLICNAFWIIIIRAPYSNRFAQISWFILPIVLIYPFMRERFWINQEKILGAAIVAFYSFAFITNMLPILLQ